MACRICGGYNCTECFHTIEEQEEYERLVEKYGEKGVWHDIYYYRRKEEMDKEAN